ncbi:MAG: GNAT family N-acetyltransferase [Pseudomonadota bacterium]
MSELQIQTATRRHIPQIEALLSKSYTRLLARDYPPSIMVTAVPQISKAQPALIASGRYFMAVRDGRLLAVGGWSPANQHRVEGDPALGHVRHFATDPDATRQGAAGALLSFCQIQAKEAGLAGLNCMSTRTAVPFYKAFGFEALGEQEITLGAGVVFPAERMVWRH